MREKKQGKRILSLLLIFVLSMSMWTGDVCTVRAERTDIIGDEETEDEEEEEETEEEEDEEEEEETEEEMDEIAGTIFDALYPDVQSAFLDRLDQLETEPEEDTDDADTFMSAFYEAACYLSEQVAADALDAAKEQYTELKNEKIYGKVYDLLLAKLYNDFFPHEGGYGIAMVSEGDSEDDSRTQKVDLLATSKFHEQIEADTKVTVKVGSQETEYNNLAAIDLSGVDSNNEVTFTIATTYTVLYGRTDNDGDVLDDYPLEKRDLIAGDYFTISGIPNELLQLSGELSDVSMTVDGKDEVTILKVSRNESNGEITYTFTDAIANYYNITFNASMEFTLKKEALGDAVTDVTLSLPGGKLNIKLPPKASAFPNQIEKTGVYDPDKHTITWTISITPANRQLGGYTLEDVFDTTYQELVSVKWAGNTLYEAETGNAEDPNLTVTDTPASEEQSAKTTISYTFGDSVKTSDNNVFVVTTRLNDKAEMALLNQALALSTTGNAFSQLSNQATLTSPADGDNEQTTFSSEKKVDIPTPAKPEVTKDYEQISADVIRWKITVNPGGARIWKAVVTDTLDSRLSLIEGTVRVSGQQITAEQNEQVYYTYPYTDNSTNTENGETSESEAGNGNTLAVTFTDGYLANQTIELTFETTIDKNDDYTNGSQEIQNAADILCYFPDYSAEGDDYIAWETGTIETAELAELMLTKEYAGFDNTDGMITWKLKPSYAGASAFDTVTITDYVGKKYNSTSGSAQAAGDHQTLSGDTANVQVWLEASGAEPERQLTEGADYSCEIDTDNNTLTITFPGNTSENGESSTALTTDMLNRIYITYQTHADNWGVSATEQTYYNTAFMQITSGENTLTSAYDDASRSLTNHMITKNAVSYYDNEDGKSGFCYTMYVNNDKVKLSSAVLEDDLTQLNNESTSGAKLILEKVTISENGGAAETIVLHQPAAGENITYTYTYTGDENTLGILRLDLSNFVKAGESVTVTVYVMIDNSGEFFKKNGTIFAENTASVKTELENGSSGQFTASGGGPNQGQITNKLVNKTFSSVDTENRAITYTIQINPRAAAMGTVVLTDTLTDENVEYDDESFHLYHGIYDETGNFKKGTEAEDDKWNFSLQNNADGSAQADITIYSCTEPYILEYTVLALDNASGMITNRVELSADGVSDYSSVSQQFAFAGSGTASMLVSITVKKMYQDPVTGEEKPLAGAVFVLRKQNGKIKTAVTNSDGVAVFKALAKNQTYWIRESEAPEGYEITEQGEREIQINGTDETVVFYNTRSTGTVEFTKTDSSETRKGLVGAEFLLYYEENGTTMLARTQKSGDGIYQFTELADTANDVEADRQKAGDLITSGTAGRVKVTDLPWGAGSYYFVEIQAPTGYQADSTKRYRFYVRPGSESANTVQVSYDTGESSSDTDGHFTEGTNGCLITNSVYQFSLLIQDTDGNPMNGVTVEFYEDENCTTPVTFPTGTAFLTGADGKVTIVDSRSAGDIAEYYLKIGGRFSDGSSFSVEPLGVQFSDGSTYVMIVMKNEDGNYILQSFDYITDESTGGENPAEENTASGSSSGSSGSGKEGSGGGNDNGSGKESSGGGNDDGSEAGDSVTSGQQLPDTAAESETGSSEKGRNVKTGDRTPIVSGMVLAAAALGLFIWLTVLLKKKKKALHNEKD